MKLLLADDDEISCEILKETLSQWGFDVVVALNGNDAWDILDDKEPPRLVVLDWMMPGLTGPEICQKLREKQDPAYTYIILLTGKKEQNDLITGLQAGADDYLTKPVDPKELEVRLSAGHRVLTLESALIHTLDTLKQTEHNRREFIAALTHDLRTPLIAEKKALELIQQFKEEISPRVQTFFKLLLTNNENLLQLVNQLLESFHAEEVRIELSKEPVVLHTIISECIMSVFSLSNPKHILINNNVAPHTAMGSTELCADPQHLKRIIINLLSNAISTSPNNAIININCVEKGSFWEIQIQDNGPGINPALLPHLFERYHPNAGMTRQIGTGLGLSICKTLVELHGGTISVESAVTTGTCFYFTLPKTEHFQPQPRQKEGPIDLIIVEDQEIARIGLKFSLEGFDGIKVTGMAENGKRALTLTEELSPEVILMDITMPEMDGITATQHIKAAHPQIKVIMLTSHTEPKEIYAALNAGADGYCTKDVKSHTLVEIITKVAHGQKWLDPGIAEILATGNISSPQLISSSDRAKELDADLSLMELPYPDKVLNTSLSEREIQILRLLARHTSIDEMAQILYVSPIQIHRCIDSIIQKLSVDNIVEAEAKAIQTGLLK